MIRDKADELWKTFLERTTLPLWIPDKMANAERCEIFALVPRSEAGDSSIAFVLPDFFPDSERVSVRERCRGNCLGLKENARNKKKRGAKSTLL